MPVMKRLLLILAVPLALVGFTYVVVPAMLAHWLTTADPYPSFMADWHSPRLYADLESSFDQFVAQHFPIGSNAQEAIAKIGEEFRVLASKEGLHLFTGHRHAGPCGEDYSIRLRENSDGAIAEISGRVRHRCL
jgi:hypothetical protein